MPALYNSKMDGPIMNKLLAVTTLATAAATMQAHAFKFDTPSDWDVRWDNTVKGRGHGSLDL
jgi:hypothetical protein